MVINNDGIYRGIGYLTHSGMLGSIAHDLEYQIVLRAIMARFNRGPPAPKLGQGLQ